jgi:uncharacterized protein (DUF362 family)
VSTARVFIRSARDVEYPAPDDAFSPDEAYPEYRQGQVATDPNPVYRALRTLFADAELDPDRIGSPGWNPLGALIPEGARVFVLCNFVYHRRPSESENDFQAKCIHGSVLRALIDYALLATGLEGRVLFGNAPLQSCDWAAVQRETGASTVARFYRERGLPVEARDLRLRVTQRGAAGGVRQVEARDPGSAVEIDLGAASMLERQGQRAPRYRVSDYDPDRTEAFHNEGSHRYLMHRDVLESDVVISLSKLKTHEKVGITCGLKGFVGAVGHKDCLAHHRFGSPRVGGDEYPDRFAFLQPLSSLHDWVYRRGSGGPLQRVATSTDRVLRTLVRRSGAVTTGAWHGNDTAWRMSHDLARILRYADARGVLCASPQRRHLSLVDGIVAGEGEGPLDPRPANAGALIFGEDVACVDRIASRLMGFDPCRIPLVREAFAADDRPISDCREGDEITCWLNGEQVPEGEIAPAVGRPFLPPSGWRDHLGS